MISGVMEAEQFTSICLLSEAKFGEDCLHLHQVFKAKLYSFSFSFS